MWVRILLFLVVILFHGSVAVAQTRKATPAKPAEGSDSSKSESSPEPQSKKIDTVIIDPIKPPRKPAFVADPSNMKQTVIVISSKDTTPKPKVTYKDTVIILKKGLTKEQLAEREKQKVIEELKGNNYCNCVKMDIKVSSVLLYETYLNYDFIFKNDCKIDVWVSTKHFRFTPLNAFDQPVKVLRKLSFVQRYGQADFEKLAPGEVRTFSQSDDAFFEYDLKKGETYKFLFEHRNFGDRNKIAPEKTYLCGQRRVQMITVK